MKLLRSVCTFLVVMAVAGCTYPGMITNVIAPGNDHTFDLQTEDISSKADIFAITPDIIRQLSEEKLVADKQLQQQRIVAGDAKGYQYRIGPQDILRITVWDHPELNNPSISPIASLTTATSSSTTASALGVIPGDINGRVVNNDGTMFYPYVGMIQVSGKTVQEIRKFLEVALVKVIKDPQVDVSIQGYRSQRVYVSGEVKVPGVVPISDVPLRITDAISAVGGLGPDADPVAATLTRAGSVIPINLYALLNGGDVSQNLVLQDGDVLSLPDHRLSKVFILGEVAKATSVPMPRGRYSLSEALSDVGGISQITGNASQVYVFRTSGGGRMQIYHLDASRPYTLVLADAFDLQSRDVIFVDPVGISRWNRVISQILPSAQVLQAGVNAAR